MLRITLLSIAVLGISLPTHAQLFKRMMKRAQDKIEQRIEDKVVEEISEEIANRAMRPVNEAFDAMFRKKYKETYGEEYDDSKYEDDPQGRAADIQGLINAMYGNADLPAAYDFNYSVEIEVYDYGQKKPNNMQLLIATGQNSNGIMGFSDQSRGTDQIMVFDFDKDHIAIFDNQNQTVMALPGVFSMASAMALSTQEEASGEDIKIEKMNKTKTILGYQAQGYKTESDETKGEFYVSRDLPFDWSDSFGRLSEKFSGNFLTSDRSEPIRGMLLKASTKRKKDKKESKWIVTAIDKTDKSITTSQYKNSMSQK